MTVTDAQKAIADEKISLNVSRRVGQPSLHRWRPDLPSEFQRPVRPDEVVIAAKQLQVIF